MMSSWATFWGWTLGISLVLFAVISIVVTIGGFRDIQALLAQTDSGDEDIGDDPGGAEE